MRLRLIIGGTRGTRALFAAALGRAGAGTVQLAAPMAHSFLEAKLAWARRGYRRPGLEGSNGFRRRERLSFGSTPATGAREVGRDSPSPAAGQSASAFRRPVALDPRPGKLMAGAILGLDERNKRPERVEVHGVPEPRSDE